MDVNDVNNLKNQINIISFSFIFYLLKISPPL